MSILKTGSPFMNRKRRTTHEYLWKDKSGRGLKNSFNKSNLIKALSGTRSWHGEAISTWANRADVGDEWENAANKVIRTV